MQSINFQISAPHQAIKADLIHKINHKTKPLGSLGMLETLALQVGLIQQTLSPQLNLPTMLIFAGDHGITQAGVSPYPQAVTAQMVLNFLAGGAAINVFCQQNQLHFRVVDAGVNAEFTPHPYLIDAKVALGTANFLETMAMTTEQCELALVRGAEIADAQINAGCNVMGFGEMGIGNTSSASVIMSVLCRLPIAACVGRGTGLDDVGLAHKTQQLARALALHQLDGANAKQVLATFGGFEIAMMVGAMLQAATRQCTLMIDGFITTAALLVAAQIQPNIVHYCVFSHCSDESGHQALLAFLKGEPVLKMRLRLGEGTGAALVYPMLLAAVNFLNQMASFESAQVSQRV